MKPYKDFGIALKAYRVAVGESLEELSGALEIEPDRLHRFESGEELPNSDLLEMLISHLSLRDREADRLWELAGYDEDDEPKTSSRPELTDHMRLSIQLVDPAQIVFTDAIQVVKNKFGVILNFGQQNHKDLKVVSRLGMSEEHARKVLKALSEALQPDSRSDEAN